MSLSVIDSICYALKRNISYSRYTGHYLTIWQLVEHIWKVAIKQSSLAYTLQQLYTIIANVQVVAMLTGHRKGKTLVMK